VIAPELPGGGAVPLEGGAPATAVRPKHGTFRSDVFTLVSGTTLAQLLSILTAPILTHLYDPKAFGMSALFASLTGIPAVVVCMRYELAIMLPERDEEAANMLGASLLVALLVSLAAVPVVFFGHDAIVRLLKSPELGRVLWLVPPMLLVAGIFLALNHWNSRTKHFKRLAAARVSASATTSVVQVAAGAAGQANGFALVGATVIGSGVATSVLGGQILRDDARLLWSSLQWKKIREGLWRYRKFPFYSTASSLLNSVSWQLPALLLQFYFSTSVVGLYALGNRVLRVPMDLIGVAIGQVFFPRAAEARRRGELAKTVESAFRRLAVLSLLPITLLAIVGRDAFSFIFGARWAEAGVYAQILAPWTFFWFLSSPLSTLFSVLERQESGLKLDAVILGTRFASLAAGGWLQNARLALALFSVTGVLVYAYYSFAILKASHVAFASLGRFLLRRFAELLPAVAILVALKAAGFPPGIVVAAAAALFAIYGIWTVKRDPALAGLLKFKRLARA
jgi:lipopolysaccharide exporter